MDKSKIKKPFFLTKDYWSKNGKDKQIAEAKYKLSGEKLERELDDANENFSEETIERYSY